MNDEIMDALIKRMENDPELAKCFQQLLHWSQMASIANMSMEEVANVCTMGWVIGKDPGLGEMISNINKIKKKGLKIVEK